jgi:hypothetical protein
MTCKPATQIPSSLKKVTPDEIKPTGFTSANPTTGLNKDKVAPNGPTIPSIVQYLSNVDFGATTDQKNNEWDCVDRALWGIAYARQKFPGIAVGMAEGVASVGSINNGNHAVMILWDKDFNYLYHDPLQPGKPVTFNSIERIFAFPFGSDGQIDTVDPLRKLMLPRIKDNNYVHWDTEYQIYPKTTDDRRGIEDYLSYAVYDPKCIDLNSINLDYWKAADAALWSYMHVRRHYKGAAIGLAFGVPDDPNKSKVVNLIWTLEANKIKPVFWDPNPKFKMEVGFTPKRVFF